MDLPYTLFSLPWHFAAVAISVWVFWHAGRRAPWTRLQKQNQRNLLFGFTLALMLFWSLRAGVKPGLNLHVLGAMAATLTLGVPLALLAFALALTGLTINGAIQWQAWAINFVFMAVVPIYFADFFRRQVERRLPAHFFIFIFISAFFGAALTVVMQGSVAAVAMWLAGAYEFELLAGEYLPYFVLLGFSEAWLSGAAVTLMVVYKPEWVCTFDDNRYLVGK